MSAPFKTNVVFLALQNFLVFLVKNNVMFGTLAASGADIMASSTHKEEGKTGFFSSHKSRTCTSIRFLLEHSH